MIKNVLSIAGSDPSGGAGVQADLKTFAALGAYGMAAITALTAQNTCGVSGIEWTSGAFMDAQLRPVFEDIRVDAVKIGMAGMPGCIEAVSAVLQAYAPPHIVLDPVMVATSGDDLSSSAAVQALRARLLPLATVITPNIPEAEILLGRAFDGDLRGFAQGVRAETGARAVLLKGGHLEGDLAMDIYIDVGGVIELSAPRIVTKNTHGTGCTLSSALAVFLAQGYDGAESARRAKDYITGAIAGGGDLDVGSGHGPIHHSFENSG